MSFSKGQNGPGEAYFMRKNKVEGPNVGRGATSSANHGEVISSVDEDENE